MSTVGPGLEPTWSKVRLAHDVKQPKPTYYIKTSRYYLDEKSRGPYMKVDPSRVPSPPAGSLWQVRYERMNKEGKYAKGIYPRIF